MQPNDIRASVARSMALQEENERKPLIQKAGQAFPVSLDPGLSLPGVIFALMCTSCGAGIVAVPRALSLAGCGIGLVILFFVAGLNGLSLHCLFRCARYDRSCSSYHVLAQRHLPPQVSLLIEAAIGLLLLGAVGTTFLLSTHVLSSAQLAAVGRTLIKEDLLSLVLFVIILPICLARNFAALQWVNLVNFSCILGAVALICHTSVRIMKERVSDTHAPYLAQALASGFSSATSLSGALAAVPIAFYVFFNQISAPQLFTELRHEERPHASAAGGVATLACALLYAAVGTLGYACFGPATGSDILIQLGAHDIGDPWLCVAQALFGVVLLCSMPLIMTPLRTMVVLKISSHTQVEETPFLMHFAITALILGTAALIARTVPGVDVLMGILGATSVAFLALTVPGALALRCLCNPSDRLAGYVLLCAGIVATPITLGALVAKSF